MKYTFSILSFLLLFTACRKQIDIKLKDADKKIVIDSRLVSGTTNFKVCVTKTGNFFGESNIETLSNATVVLSEGANSYNLTPTGNGKYELPLFSALENKNYTLSVTNNGDIYEATSFVPEGIIIEDLNSNFENSTIFSDEGYVIYVDFHDPKSETNYYRIDGTVNGKKFGGVKEIILFNDELENGNLVSYPAINALELGDVVVVNLYHLNFSAYNYYKELNLALNAEGEEAAPTNPINNWSNNALGNFSTMAVSTAQIVIQ